MRSLLSNAFRDVVSIFLVISMVWLCSPGRPVGEWKAVFVLRTKSGEVGSPQQVALGPSPVLSIARRLALAGNGGCRIFLVDGGVTQQK